MHSRKEDTTSTLVACALNAGNLNATVELCIQACRWADALSLARGKGLVMRTRMAYFNQVGDSAGRFVLCRWAEGDAFESLVGELGERVWSIPKMAKEEKREAARVCFMAGKKLDKLFRIWEEEAREEEQVGESQGGKYGIRAKAAQGFVEKAVAFSTAVGFSQGLVSEAVLHVEQVPTGCGDVQWLQGAFEKKVNGTASTSKGTYGAPRLVLMVPYLPDPTTLLPRDPMAALASTWGPYAVPPSSSGPYGAPPTTTGPYSPPPSTTLSRIKPATTAYGAQAGYNLPGPPFGQQPWFWAPMVPVPPSPGLMVPPPPPTIDQPSGPPPPRIITTCACPAAGPAAAIRSPFPDSPIPQFPSAWLADHLWATKRSGYATRAMSPPGGPPRGTFPQTSPPRAGATIPPLPHPHNGGYAPPPPSSFVPPPDPGQYAPCPSQNSGAYAHPPSQGGSAYAPAPPPPGVNPGVPPHHRVVHMLLLQASPIHIHLPPARIRIPQSGPRPPPAGGAPQMGTSTSPAARAVATAFKHSRGIENILALKRFVFEVLNEHLG
ncbi:Steroid receptor RNA activator (SRA1) [Rhizoctonia solani]|uniref:Steroid receptor RNA activator (SRA1) n=1 Tax=Rhizoctonia solani TaxID=456999 RepID=A0A8H7LZQ9_9AGAM|nr:Steroid receptor RNA activator (SRA1) [Rhizoctonia solani]